MHHTLDIVIVNWNSGGQLRDCLNALACAETTGLSLQQVVVVDNSSTDGSMDELETLELPLTVLRNDRNMGFSRACNQGAKQGMADSILFLNPDVRVFRDSLVKPMTFLNRTEEGRAGIVGIQLVDALGQITQSCARFPKPADFFYQMMGLDRIFKHRFPGHFLEKRAHGNNRQVDQVMGAFFMVRRDLYEALGGFDERFFVYYEDLDFSLRASQKGYASWFLADARAFHRGCGTSDAVKKERLYYYLKSRIAYVSKHFGRMKGLLLLLGTILLEPFFRIPMTLFRRPAGEVIDIIGGYGLLMKHVLRFGIAGGEPSDDTP